MKMKNSIFFVSIESIESLESLEPQYRFGLESVYTEKSVSIDSSKCYVKLIKWNEIFEFRIIPVVRN
jgi:hypothetical protein